MDHKEKRVLLTSFSLSPQSEDLCAYNYLKSQGVTDISALYWGDDSYAEQIPDDVKKIKIDSLTSITPDLLEGYDLVFRHTSTHPDLLTGANVTTVTQEFFRLCPAPIIGVTGTKGKGTTSSLIAKILEETGKKVHLVGNIGNPSLNVLPEISQDDIVVHEISSFQLWDLKQSPQVAVVLMVEPDHMDVHKNMEEYVAAKGNITKYQTVNDWAFYHPTNEFSVNIGTWGQGKSEPYMTKANSYIENNKVMLKGQEVCEVEEVGLIGPHNLENICAAVAAASKFTEDIGAIKRAVTSFTGLENRLEFVRQVAGVDYINDSFAAAPLATKAAINSFKQPIVLIVGGADKSLDLSDLALCIAEGSVKKAILIGQVKHKLAELLQASGYQNFEVTEQGGMSEIVAEAQASAEAGDVVLLSPGTSSFDMFKDYKDRGQQFKDEVGKL